MATTKITIDRRELELIELFKAAEPRVEFSIEPLPVGTVVVTTKETSQVFVRKTYHGLSSSIKDGTWREEKKRLVGTFGEANVCYIIEGASFRWSMPDKFHCNIYTNSIKGAIVYAMFRDNVKVVQTGSLKDTHTFMMEVASRHANCATRSEDKDKQVPLDIAPAPAVAKATRKGGNDELACFKAQLACIPMVSLKKATAICEHMNVTSMGELVPALMSNPRALCEIQGIGDVTGENICKFIGVPWVSKMKKTKPVVV